MTIRFVCICGKHLRARDDLSMRRMRCPGCGAPVGIPSLKPLHRGLPPGTPSPAERHRERLCAPRKSAPPEPDAFPLDANRPPSLDQPSAAPCRPVDPGIVRLVFQRERHQKAARRQLETRWYQCLAYPVRTARLILGLGGTTALLLGSAALLLPRLGELRSELAGILIYFMPLALVPLVLLGYAAGFLESVLLASQGGHTAPVRQPVPNIGLALKSLATWLVCFLAGPVLPAAAAFYFWLYAGDLKLADTLIVAELAILALGTWWLVLTTVCQRQSWLDAQPVRVVQLVRSLGLRSLFAVITVATLVLADGWLVILALEKVHSQGLLGFLYLSLALIGGLSLVTFLFRLLGIWCYHTKS